MSSAEQIQSWLASQEAAMLRMTQDLVNIDGGTYDKAGVDQVADYMVAFFKTHGLDTESHDGPKFGRATFTRTGQRGDGAKVLLMGHRDTVFPKGEAQRRPFHVHGERAYGPGVSDMKAGLVMQAHVLLALRQFGKLHTPIEFMTTGDEEISSPWSRPVIERNATGAVAAFNAEPGRANGAVVIARKGSVYFRFDIQGTAAHSGANFKDGASAINAMAHKVLALDKLVNHDTGITVNVGLVQGGQSINTTAPAATGQIDLRYVEPEQRGELIEKISEIVRRADIPGTKGDLEIFGEMLPMPQRESTMGLYGRYKDSASVVGFDVAGAFTGGCSDSGFTSAMGVPTLCAVGPVGGRAHTADEYVEIPTIVQRAQALALTVHGIAGA